MKLFVIACILLLICSPAGFAQKLGECESEVRTTCSLRISVCPAGDFEHIRTGCGGDSDYIEIIVRDEGYSPVAGIPPTDFWMNACDAPQELAVCDAPFFLADSMTGPNGRTTFSGQIAAGGCILTGGVFFVVQGKTLMDLETCAVPICLDVVIVSPDINADGQVNLSDLSFFGQSYNHQLGEPEYNPCCDFNDDEDCNLSDFSYVGEHYQHECD